MRESFALLVTAAALAFSVAGCASIWGFQDLTTGADGTAPEASPESSTMVMDGGPEDVVTDTTARDVLDEGDTAATCPVPQTIPFGASDQESTVSASLFQFTVPEDTVPAAASVVVRVQSQLQVSGIIVSTRCDAASFVDLYAGVTDAGDAGISLLPNAIAGPGGLYTRGTLSPGTYYLIFTWDQTVAGTEPYTFDLLNEPPALNASCAAAAALTPGAALTGNSFATLVPAPCGPLGDAGALPSTPYGELFYSVTIPANTGWQIAATPPPVPVWKPWSIDMEAFSTCANSACAQTVVSPAPEESGGFALVNNTSASVSYVIGVGASAGDVVTGGGHFQLSATVLPPCSAGGVACTAGAVSGICCGTTCEPSGVSNACGTSCSASCPAGDVCSAGGAPPCTCPTGQTSCNSQCVDETSDVSDCGGCGNQCKTSDPHATSVSCTKGVCGTTCASGWGTHCPAGPSGLCTNALSDPNNCGACGNTCPTYEACVNGTCECSPTSSTPNACTSERICTNLQTDSKNCGQCGTVCATGKVCSGGTCVCNPSSATPTSCSGICTDTTSNANHCGTCTTQCPVYEVCYESTCECSPSSSTPNVCGTACTNIATDPNNCGNCGNKCAPVEMCSRGICECPTAGAHYCGANVCAVLASDVNHCGGCKVVCAAPSGGTVTCSGGDCEPSCPTTAPTTCGAAPGTCTNLQTDNSNCGKCGTVCAGGQTCQKGTCTCPTATPRLCSGSCVNIDSNNSDCGSCGNACPTGTSCNGSGVCTDICNAGTLLCSGGCVPYLTDPNNCGACGNKCVAATGANPACVGGECTSVCTLAGYSVCSDTCVNEQTDPNNCGACSNKCVAATGANAGCVGGTCTSVCTAMAETVCSGTCVNESIDSNNCGACGNACAAGTTCCGGLCISVAGNDSNCGACGNVCGTGTTCCGGFCINVQGTDPNNCSACGKVCANGTDCCGGLCADLSTDSSNCGACGTVCPAGTSCMTSSCETSDAE